MKIELEFLDSSKTCVHEGAVEYDGMVPIPDVGETACVEGRIFRVTKRDFFYGTHAPRTDGIADMKVSFWCEELTQRSSL